VRQKKSQGKRKGRELKKVFWGKLVMHKKGDLKSKIRAGEPERREAEERPGHLRTLGGKELRSPPLVCVYRKNAPSGGRIRELALNRLSKKEKMKWPRGKREGYAWTYYEFRSGSLRGRSEKSAKEAGLLNVITDSGVNCSTKNTLSQNT